ncbi:SET domain-containing protein [Pleurotus eryngii]|uniref:SET domain-containing protein n=1 Tax=Pleurotus eryngii TaxID=5323 RepID=A0A9P6A3C2_PLEER|nr:SET domain-containing protein [Pleurotus eryngii]
MPVDAPPPAALVANIFTTQPQDGALSENVECILHSAAAKQELIEYPNFPQPTPRSHTNPLIPALLASLSDDKDNNNGEGQGAEVSAPYRIAEVPSKGLGMLATRAIPQGAFIMSERPLLLGPQVQHLDGHNMQFTATATARQRQRAIFTEAEKNLRIAFARMDPTNQKAYMALHNAHQSDGSGPITGVMRTNAYEVCRLDGQTYAGVFKDLSRINHSCSPNTTSHFDRASLSMLLFAVRDIPSGAEITSHYCGLLQPRAARARALKPYGIRCACAACTDHAASDANRLRISRVTDAVPAIVRWAGSPALPDDLLLRPTLALLQVIEAEGLEGSQAYVRVLYHAVLILQVLAVARGADMDRLLLARAAKWATLRGCRSEGEGGSEAQFREERERVMAAALARAGSAPEGGGEGRAME